MQKDHHNGDRLKQLYLVEKWSARRISDEMGCSHSTILCQLKKHEIEVRSEDVAGQRRGQIGYGKRVVHGREVRNQTEEQHLAKMHQLRDEGFSYHKIAAIFNSMGVPTKKRGAKWHATTVMNLLTHLNQHS